METDLIQIGIAVLTCFISLTYLAFNLYEEKNNMNHLKHKNMKLLKEINRLENNTDQLSKFIADLRLQYDKDRKELDAQKFNEFLNNKY